MKTAKKTLSLFLALVMLCLAIPFAALQVSANAPGDVNGNEAYDAQDYMLIKAYVLKTLKKVTDEQLDAMDANEDGAVNPMDYMVVRNAVLSGKKIEIDEPDEPGIVAADVALGAKYETNVAAASNYEDTNHAELTDGLYAPKGVVGYTAARLSGYQPSSVLTVTIDLGQVYTTVHRFEASYLSTSQAGIKPPSEVTVQISNDKTNWTSIGTCKLPAYREDEMLVASLDTKENVSCRYVRFNAKKALSWLFFDEFAVIADVERSGDIKDDLIAKAYAADTASDSAKAEALKSVSTGTPDRTLNRTNIASGCVYRLSGTPVSSNPDEDYKLTDSLTGFYPEDEEFVGFDGKKDLNIDVTLAEEEVDVCGFSLRAYQEDSLDILHSPCVTVLVSSDRASWTEVGRMYATQKRDVIFTYSLELPNTVKAKYVRFFVMAADCRMMLIDEVSVFAYRYEKYENSFYPALHFPSVTTNLYWDSSAADYTTEQNLIKGKSQQIRCFGNSMITFNGNNTDVSSRLMTDGKYSSNSNIHCGDYFKFNGGSGREIYYDLGKVSTLTYFKAGFNHRTEWGVYAPGTVDVLVSMDAKTWYKAGEMKPAVSRDPSTVRATLMLSKKVAARFVCFTFTMGSWVGIDELEVFGTKKVDTAVKTADKIGYPVYHFADSEDSEYDWAGPSKDLLGGVKDVFLAYHGKSTVRTEEDLLYEVAYMGEDGKIKDTMFDGVLFLMSGQFPSELGGGTGGVLSYNKSDAEWLLETLFKKGQNIQALESAVGKMKSTLGLPSSYKVKYFVSLYYPRCDNFGDIDGDGANENLNTIAGKTKVLKWWIDEFEKTKNKYDFKNIEFAGYYWYNESLSSEQIPMTTAVRDKVHSYGSQFFWIPYFSAGGVSTWKDYGFDIACLQPNYAFHLDVPDSRVRIAANLAKYYGMCLEIECDGAVGYDERFRLKYYEYLKQGALMGYMTEATHLYYLGMGIHTYAKSQDARVRQIYDYTYQFIHGTLKVKPDTVSGKKYSMKKDKVLSGLTVDNDSRLYRIRVYEGPKHGSVAVNEDGTFNYYPNHGYTGTDTFTFCYSSGMDETDPIKVTITVK